MTGGGEGEVQSRLAGRDQAGARTLWGSPVAFLLPVASLPPSSPSPPSSTVAPAPNGFRRSGWGKRGGGRGGGRGEPDLEGRWSSGLGLNLTRGDGGGVQVKESGRGDGGERREGQAVLPTAGGSRRTWWLRLGVVTAVRGVVVAAHHQLRLLARRGDMERRSGTRRRDQGEEDMAF